LTEIRLQDERHDGGRQQQDRQYIRRHVAAACAFRKCPGRQHDEGGLDEFGGLNAEDPAPGAFHLVAKHDRGDHQRDSQAKDQQRRAAHMAWREKGRGDHQGRSRDEIADLSIDEVKGGQAKALCDRWRTGQRQHKTQHHQGAKRGQQPAIDGPPPIGEGRSFSARDHGFSSH
jgi:hypothetical protein